MIMGELLFKGSLSDEETKQIRVNGSSGIHIISYFSIDGMLKLKMILKRSLRDAFQKKTIWRDIVPTSYYPLPLQM